MLSKIVSLSGVEEKIWAATAIAQKHQRTERVQIFLKSTFICNQQIKKLVSTYLCTFELFSLVVWSSAQFQRSKALKAQLTANFTSEEKLSVKRSSAAVQILHVILGSTDLSFIQSSDSSLKLQSLEPTRNLKWKRTQINKQRLSTESYHQIQLDLSTFSFSRAKHSHELAREIKIREFSSAIH